MATPKEDLAYSQFVLEMLDHEYGNVDPKLVHIILGIASEGGEVADVLKSAICYDETINITKLKKELGDLLFFIRALCTFYGWNEDDIRNLNLKSLIKRCPNGFNIEDHKAGKSKE